ncbi:MAG: L-threonylcarbamoyladenylate synthase [Syntrophobacterales bacterium]|jgi:L-threonylcarbamoyladenylate synthase|nr:L-threonylcarbamoyladenylate synthase [Syntrophobacterales bacterium]
MGRIWAWREEAGGAFWAEARAVLEKNRVLAVPTETFYGLAVNPFREEALARLFALKARAPEKPVLVLVDGPERLAQVVREVPEVAARLMARFWPGPLTIIFPSLPQLPRRLTGGTGTIGVRQPRQGLTCRLITELGFPITGTSANRSDRPPLARAADVAREFGDEVDLILDAGPCPGGLPSTIVDVTSSPPRLVRPGAIVPMELAEIMPEMEPIPDERGAR